MAEKDRMTSCENCQLFTGGDAQVGDGSFVFRLHENCWEVQRPKTQNPVIGTSGQVRGRKVEAVQGQAWKKFLRRLWRQLTGNFHTGERGSVKREPRLFFWAILSSEGLGEKAMAKILLLSTRPWTKPG